MSTTALERSEREKLHDYFHYYRNLSPESKLIFESRLVSFRDSKAFYSPLSSTVPDEIKLMISASAIQVTFGLKMYQLPHFKTFVIYPKRYTSPQTGKLSSGEVNTNGAIVVSWQDYLLGLKAPNDGYNVGIHELAHAVLLENLVPNEAYQFLDSYALTQWKEHGRQVLIQMRKGALDFLRHYACRNIDELFAVTTEAFFETPAKLKEKLPDLYVILRKILLQDPQNVKDPVVSLAN